MALLTQEIFTKISTAFFCDAKYYKLNLTENIPLSRSLTHACTHTHTYKNKQTKKQPPPCETRHFTGQVSNIQMLIETQLTADSPKWARISPRLGR